MTKSRRLETFGGRLRLAREEAELTQEQLTELLSERYGVSVGRSYLSELERNWEANKMPMSDVTAALAKALGVNGNWLLLLSDDQEQMGSESARSMSPEGDELARIADALPPWRRRELLALAQTMAGTAEDMAPVAGEMTAELRSQLAAAQLVIGEPAVRAIETAVLRFLAGNTPGADSAAIGLNGAGDTGSGGRRGGGTPKSNPSAARLGGGERRSKALS